MGSYGLSPQHSTQPRSGAGNERERVTLARQGGGGHQKEQLSGFSSLPSCSF